MFEWLSIREEKDYRRFAHKTCLDGKHFSLPRTGSYEFSILLEWMVIRFVTQNLCGCKQVGLHSQDFYRGMLLFNKSCGDMGRFENMETSFSRLHNKVLVTSACDGGFKDEREWSIDAGLLSIVQRSLHSTVAIYAVYMASHTGLFHQFKNALSSSLKACNECCFKVRGFCPFLVNL